MALSLCDISSHLTDLYEELQLDNQPHPSHRYNQTDHHTQDVWKGNCSGPGIRTPLKSKNLSVSLNMFLSCVASYNKNVSLGIYL